MKTIEETYRGKLKLLIDEYGSQTELSRVIDKSPSQISQWVNASPDSKTGKPRSLKAETAREIEQKTGKPKGWFDQPIQAQSGNVAVADNTESSVYFDIMDIEAAAGTGIFNGEHPEVIRTIGMSEEWALQHLGKNFARFAVISARGDSMLPTFNNGDVLFVDPAVNRYDGEGIYVFTAADGLKVKRLQSLSNGSLKIISDNKQHYDVEILSGQDLEYIRICGRVAAWWVLKSA